MPELTIEAVGRLEAGEILSSPSRCVEVTYILSIGDPFDELPLGYSNVPDKLRLLIADVVTELGATDEDVWQIIRLADTLRAATGTVLIHCEAGISRSTAAALIMHSCQLGPGLEQAAMRRVLEQRPIALPNRRMIEIADRLLQRKGNLLAVVTDHATFGSA